MSYIYKEMNNKENFCRFIDTFENYIDYNGLSNNPNIDIDIITGIKKDIQLNFHKLSANKGILQVDIENHPDYQWSYMNVTNNPNINIQGFIKNQDNLTDNNKIIDLYWKNISINACKNKKINIDIISEYSHLPWKYDWMSLNPNITIEFIVENMSYNWDWYDLSKNEAFTMDIIEKYIELPWDLEGISSNPNLTFDFFNKYKKENGKIKGKFDMLAISRNINIDTLDYFLNDNVDFFSEINGYYYMKNISYNNNFIYLTYKSKKFIDIIYDSIYGIDPCIWQIISSNPSIDMSYIIMNKQYPWNYTGISRNPNLTIEYIQEHITCKWDWYEICGNIYTKEEYEYNGLKFID